LATIFVSVPHIDEARMAEDASPLPDESLHTGGVKVSPFSVGFAAGPSVDRLTAGRKAAGHSSGATFGLAIAAVGVFAALAGYGAIGLATAILALAISLAKDRSVLSCVPTASTLVMTAVVVLVQFPAIANWPNFGITVVARMAVAGLGIAAGLFVWLRRRASPSLKVTDLPEVVALSPALFLAGVGVWMATMPVNRATNWFFIGADNVSHGLSVAIVGAMGRLDYSLLGKPGGWQSVVSLAVVARGDASGTPDGLLELVSTNAAMLWTLYVLVCAATSLLAMALVRQYGGHCWAASIAGLAAGSVMCWPQFFTFTMGAGFQSTIVLTFLLAVSAYEVLMAKAGEIRAVIICSAAVVMTAHAYPLGLPIAGVLWLGAMARHRQGRGVRVDRRDRPAIVIVVCSALAIAPVLQMLASVDGVQTAQSPVGFTMRLPVEWVVAGVLAGALCLARSRRSRAAGWVGLAVVVAFMEPIAAWLLLDVSMQNYYPTKLLWHVAALGVPLVAACCTVGCLVLAQRFGRRGVGRVLSKAASVIVTITFLGGFAGVLPAALGEWSKDGGRILKAAASPFAPNAQVVWRAGQTDEEDWSIQRLVAAYHPWVGSSEGRLVTPRGLSEQCAVLRSVHSPAVLTSESQAEVTAHFNCVSGVVGVPIQDSPIK